MENKVVCDYCGTIYDGSREKCPLCGSTTRAEAAPAAKDFMSRLNPNSLTVAQGYCEPCAANAETGSVFQFLRTGYFCKDRDSTPERPVFNRTVALKDSWAKEAKK